MSDMVERVARIIANAMGDNYSDAFKNKERWNAKRGMSGGRIRDVNEPMQCDYLAAAEAAIAAMQADAAPVAWMYRNEVQQEYVSRVRHEFRTQGMIQWTETPLYAHPPVDDRVSTSSPVDDREPENTSDKLRDAVEVYQEAYVTWVSSEHADNAAAYQAAAAVIEADRAELVAEIERLRKLLLNAADWLKDAPIESGICCCGDPIEVHSYYSGHSPVDAVQYSAMQLREEIRAALEGTSHD